jgi:hypothetical protein
LLISKCYKTAIHINIWQFNFILIYFEVETGLEPVGTNDVINHNNSTYRFIYLIFKNVPLPPAIVVGNLPSQACALMYSIYIVVNSCCFNLITLAAAAALITCSAESAFATAIFLSPSACAAIAC